MTKNAELTHLFRAMKAPAAARVLPNLVERARQEEWSYERFAEALLSTEISSRESSGGRLRIRAARFLTARVTLTDELGVTGLDGAVVSRFLLGECDRVCLGSAKGKVAELRSLLRFLHVRGFTPRSLAESVPSVAVWRETTIPPTMPQADIEALIASCDRSTLDGARDHAMLMLLARLGCGRSRSRASNLTISIGGPVICSCAARHAGMTGSRSRLMSGAALAAYLALRGRHDSRNVFLTLRAPTRPIRADLVGDVVQRHCRWAGVTHVGPHRLRHTLATQMLARSAALADISQVLRHSDLATTAIYAKVDLSRLREVARPWPGTAR